jgi:hypothetical protein
MTRSTLLEAWQIYRARFALIVAVVTVVWLPCDLVHSYVDAFIFGPDAYLKSYRLGQFLDNFIGIIATAGVTFLALTARLGQPATFGSAMGAGIRSWGRLWWARFLSGLAILIGLLLLIVPGIYLLTRLAFVDTVAVVESSTGTMAMKRSFDLTEGRFWKTFLFSIAAFVCCLVPAAILLFIEGAVQALVPALDHWLIDALFELVIDVLTAFVPVAFLCAYAVFDRESSQPPLDATAAPPA